MKTDKYRINKKFLKEGQDYWVLESNSDSEQSDFNLSLFCYKKKGAFIKNKDIFIYIEDALNFILAVGLEKQEVKVAIFNYKNPIGKLFTFNGKLKQWESSELLNNTKPISERLKLSNQEYLVAELTDKGYRNHRISQEMDIHEKTVSTYLRRLYKKSGLAPEYNVHALLIRLKEMGLLNENV